MRLVHLTPGTGSFHCGSCLRDNALIKALRSRGHDAIMVPLYLPLVTDRDVASPEQTVQVGGIGLYLQQKLPWFHRLPPFVHRWLNQPARLRWAAKFMGMTSARDLGEMAVGSLVGEKGAQWAEWQHLIDWLKQQPKFEVVSLSNSLLTGLAKAVREQVGSRVVCSLQGEDAFLDALPEPFKQQAWDALRENAAHVSRFIAPSRYYAGVMAPRLGIAADRISVVHNGIDLTPYAIAQPDPTWPVIGYLARMIQGKGLTTLVDAFIELVKRNRVPRVKLHVGGSVTRGDESYVAGLKDKLRAAGCPDRAEFIPNLTFDEKIRFFRDVTVFSVPATYGEAFGLYVVEAMACGIPVVQPDSGAFPELIQATGGGVLCKPDDPSALAEAIETLLLDESKRQQISLSALRQARTGFTSAVMAERFEQVLMQTTPS